MNTRTLLEIEPWVLCGCSTPPPAAPTLVTLPARVAPASLMTPASDVSLSEAVALLAADLGTARQNADQLRALEQAAAPDQ